MKKLLSALLCATMVLGLSGCGSDSETKKDETPKEETSNKKESKDKIKDMETALKENGITITETTEMGASLIGGTSGTKYDTDQGGVEVYKFDTNSDAYKKAVSEGVVTLEDFGDFAVTVNGEYILMNSELPQNIIDLFKSL